MSALPEKFLTDPAWQFLRQNQEKQLASQQLTARKYDPKKSVWVPDPDEGFLAAEVKSTKDDRLVVVVTSKGNERTLPKEELQLMNPPKYELIGGRRLKMIGSGGYSCRGHGRVDASE